MPEQTFQPAEGAAIDTYINENVPAGNYAGTVELIVGYDAAGNNWDTLMTWDLSSIPQGSTIEIATLYLMPFVNFSPTNISIRRILPGNVGWTEAGATWNTRNGVAAWEGGAGCEILGTDISNTVMWGPNSWAAVPGVWDEFELSVQEFQVLLDSGNYGFKIGSDTRAGGLVRRVNYHSASAVVPANRPKLYVRWIEPSGRLVEYEFNVWDPLQRIVARDGHEVPPNEVRADKWGKLLGFRSPSSKTYASLADGPDHWYISGVTSDGETVRITPDEKLFADMILKRITR